MSDNPGTAGANDEDDEEEFYPPENFAMVEPGIYRSAFPMKRNFTFLARLGIRSIVTLILEDYPAANQQFDEEHGIRLFQLGLEGNKEPFRSMPLETAVPALRTVMDAAHHPLLIHCNEGKHRTGSLVGMLRRARGWALSSTVDEYMMFAGSKARIVDQRFIELFDTALVSDPNFPPPQPQPTAPPPAPPTSAAETSTPGSNVQEKGGSSEGIAPPESSVAIGNEDDAGAQDETIPSSSEETRRDAQDEDAACRAELEMLRAKKEADGGWVDDADKKRYKTLKSIYEKGGDGKEKKNKSADA